MAKHKNASLLVITALIACVLHAVMLHTEFSYYALTSVVKVVLFVSFPLLYLKITRERRFKYLFSLKGEKRNIILSFALGLGVFAVIWAVFLFLQSFLDEAMVTGALENNGINESNFFFVFIYVVVINAALEELFFRGFIFGILHRHGKGLKTFAHVYSSLLFSIYHVPILREAVTPGMMVFCVIGLIAAGLIFNALVVKCRCITGALIVHIGANFALNTIMLYYLFGGS
jgi:membrane protease YdiL (CAAX protease family)